MNIYRIFQNWIYFRIFQNWICFRIFPKRICFRIFPNWICFRVFPNWIVLGYFWIKDVSWSIQIKIYGYFLIEYASEYFQIEYICFRIFQNWMHILRDISKLNRFQDISRQKWSLWVEAGVAQRLPCVPKGSAGISYPALDGNNISSSYSGDIGNNLEPGHIISGL